MVEILNFLKRIQAGIKGLQNMVLFHHTRHENGNSDEINVAGLSGELADQQKPKAHAPTHQKDGTDDLESSLKLAQLAEKSHSSLTNVTANQHHPQAHTLASHSTKAHSELTGVTASQHHTKTVASELNLADMAEKSHGSLTNVTASQHHIKTTNAAELVAGILALARLPTNLTGKNADKVDGYEGSQLLNSNLIPSGTKMLFCQAAAPTGWTQDVSQNDRVIRVVSGVGGGTGGNWTISGLSSGDAGSHAHSQGNTGSTGSHAHSQGNTGGAGSHAHTQGNTGSTGGHVHTTASHTLTENEMPSHSHTIKMGGASNAAGNLVNSAINAVDDQYTVLRGGGAAHSHGNTGSVGDHAHSNPNTSEVGNHAHSNPNTNSAGDHAHTNPNTNSAGSHAHTISANGAWRPSYLNVIMATKD